MKAFKPSPSRYMAAMTAATLGHSNKWSRKKAMNSGSKPFFKVNVAFRYVYLWSDELAHTWALSELQNYFTPRAMRRVGAGTKKPVEFHDMTRSRAFCRTQITVTPAAGIARV